MAGFIFCYKKTGSVVDASTLNENNSICCSDATSCSQLVDSAWVCPSVFITDDDYKIMTCPQKASLCGRKEFSLVKDTDRANVTVSGMSKGDVCNYIITVTSSDNRLPAFEIKGLNSENAREYYVKYFEFDDTSNQG